ncbi:nodC, partial [Symbiodinium sp. KB8]
VETDHGCVCIRGIKQGAVPYPFEVYVKGKDCPRSKRASQALCMSLLQADYDAGRPNPKALLLLDGDCRVEPEHVGKMYRCMQDQHLAACGPFLLTKKSHNFCLLVQLMRDWFSQRMLWLGQSAIRFQLPLNGSCAMYAMDTVRAVQTDFCRGVYEDSILDSMMIEMGEDSFMTNLVHEKNGGGIRFLPHCWATSFMPETWGEYLAQQCRWKRSHMGNRVTMLFNKPNAWLWKPTRWVFWPVYVPSLKIIIEFPKARFRV